jgi:putative cardiolipin synthase
MRRLPPLLLSLVLAWPGHALASGGGTHPMDSIAAAIAARAPASGSFVLERGEDSLIARAWLVDRARTSIEVQYFIWSTDNVGTLAAEALLRAAERGVKVRVIVDDLLVDAPDRLLLAFARHPNVQIRIYNPVHSVGTRLHERLFNVATDFRGANQRMHDKTLVVDGLAAITGGRNMADEYYDYDQAYNFRDRDALVLGPVVREIRASFERFWNDPLAVPVERRFGGDGIFEKKVVVGDAEVRRIHAELHAYAREPANFAPEVRSAIATLPARFPEIQARIAWGRVDFVADRPGKNDGGDGLGGGGLTSVALARLAGNARESLLIQSPYLVLSDPAFALLREAVARGVRVRISTNSLASTDNLAAFSGYAKQRAAIVAAGIEVYEYRPDPAVERQIMQRYAALADRAPVFALHAKSMVVDGAVAYVGTYNLDPRSENLNTEVGVVIHDRATARAVAGAIETDMRPENSWSAREDPDRHAPLAKRAKVSLLRLLPLDPLL